MPKVSIIVPVYNVEDYLDECVQSILCQSFHDIELVLVDDGSKDRSGIICDAYVQQDERVKVIHKINEGVSKARNVGIALATGDYLAFVDSDDYIEKDTYKKLLALRDKYNADICVSNKILHEFANIDVKVSVHNGEETLKKLLAMETEGDNTVSCSMCGGLYKRDLFPESVFSEEIHHYEDYYVQAILTSKAKIVVTTTEQFYHYRIREGSANHVGFSNKVATCLRIAELLRRKGVITNQQTYDDVHSFFVSQCYFSEILYDRPNILKKSFLREVIKQNLKSVRRSHSINNVKKIVIISYLIAPKLNRMIVKVLLKK